MIPVNKGARIGAAVFALGLSLAGPQAMGIASADRGGPTDSSTSDGEESTPQERDSGIRSHVRQSRPANSVVSAAQVRADGPVDGSDNANDPGAVTLKRGIEAPGRGGPHTNPHSRSGSVGQNSSRVPDVPDELPAYAAAAAGHAAAGDGIAPAPVTVPSDSPRLAPVAAAVARPQDRIETVGVKLAEVVSRVEDWLSGLPASPLTDFLSGALLLVRRTFSLPTIPKVSVGDVAVFESTPESVQQALFTVSLGKAYDSAVTVGYATEDSTGPDAAIAGVDYVSASGVLTFAPGETSKQVAVEVLSDGLEEVPETFGLSVTTAFPSSTNIELAGAEGVIVGSGYALLNAVRLTIVNQTGRKLDFKICKPGDFFGTECSSSGSLSAGSSSTRESVARYPGDSPNVFGNIGSLNFKATTSLFGPRFYTNDLDIPGEKLQQSTWTEIFYAENNAWVRDAGLRSVMIERLPDLLPDPFYGVLRVTLK